MFEMTGCESHSVLVGGRGEQESSLSLHDDAGRGTAEREADGYDGGPLLVPSLGPVLPVSLLSPAGPLQTEAAPVPHWVGGLDALGELCPRGVVHLWPGLVDRPRVRWR